MAKAITLALLVLLLLGVPPLVSPVQAAETKIKKCQDAEGKWHYGDTAAEECARSQVIELSGQGIKRREIKAPATEEQLESHARQRAEAEEAARRAEDQARRDEQLLATYGHEDDIIYIRDRKLAQIEATVGATEQTVQPLRAALSRMQAEADKIKQRGGDIPTDLAEQISKTGAQINRHEAGIAARRREQEAIRQQAQVDLERYRELKAEQAQKPQAGAPAAAATPKKP